MRAAFFPRHPVLPLLALTLCAALTTGCGRARAQDAFQPSLTQQPDGSWQVAGAGYTAAVNPAGYLASFRVGDVETIGEPLTYQPEAALKAVSSAARGDTITVYLAGKGEATVDYQFRKDGVTITPVWKGSGSASFRWNASTALLGVELLNDKRASTAGDATRFVEHGEIRGVPAARSDRNQRVRLHYPGFGLRAHVQTWGAPYNYESAGILEGRGWGRPLLEANRPFPIVLTVEHSREKASLPAPVFVPRTDQVASLYTDEEPCDWKLDLGERPAYGYLLEAGVRTLDLTWRVTDVHDREVASGQGQVPLAPDAGRLLFPVRLRTPGTGYFQALFRLSERSGKVLASSFQTRFTVIHRPAGGLSREERRDGRPISDYAVVGMIGVGGIRESHTLREFFTDQEPRGAEWQPVEGARPRVWMNARLLDECFDRAAAESRRYRLTYWFQANERPSYATPDVYEAMAYALVSHARDRCRIWEVENEPNFRYTPETYVQQCLVPFARGARRADPGCTILGPGCVGIAETLQFMAAIYAMGAGKWLDQVSTHAHTGPGESWEQHANPALLARLRALMREHGDGAKALWQTEHGYTWDNPPRLQAARYAVRQFLQGWRLGIAPSHQYYFYPQWGGFESWYQAGGGEAGSEHSWLPVAAALHFLAENTAGMQYAGDLPSPYKGVFLTRFSGAHEDVVAAWTFDFPLALAVEAPGLKRVMGFMGNPVALPKAGGGVRTLPLSGEPLYVHLAKGSPLRVVTPPFGRNLARERAQATASSAEGAHPAAHAIDGNWELWENALDLPGRTFWQSSQVDPAPQRPDWLQLTFPTPRTIDRIVALCYLPAVNPSPRDWELQADAGGSWRTLASAREDWTWVIYRQFAPVTTTRVRLLITRANDGWLADRRWMPLLLGPQATHYTDSKMRVAELEVYGPPEHPGRALRHAR